MPEKDSGVWAAALAALGHVWPWLTSIVLGTLATAAQYAQKVRGGDPFIWREAMLDLVVSLFACIMMHIACVRWGLEDLDRSLMVGLAAYSGTHTMRLFERWRDRMLGARTGGEP
ncbi:phage holin family protein [Thauera propionica]|jgi:hypothetical protein|uniref:phage holin family protein n=1 Tax=Thauera propionica TaxID=2019431 RepID=UPI0023F2DBB8|nr:phage holin family protein [Thauera propionica]MDD3676532.1 phage holin family protein [Thauera propionica]